VREWWHKGYRNGSQLYKELRAQGYKGSSKAMYNYLATLRTPRSSSSKSSPAKQQKRKSIPALPAPLENFSAQRATWLFLRKLDDLNETEQEELVRIRQASTSSEVAYRLTQAFMRMIRERTGEDLDSLARRG